MPSPLPRRQRRRWLALAEHRMKQARIALRALRQARAGTYRRIKP